MRKIKLTKSEEDCHEHKEDTMKLGITRSEAFALSSRMGPATGLMLTLLTHELLSKIEQEIRDLAESGWSALSLSVLDSGVFKDLFLPENTQLQQIVIDAIKESGFFVNTCYERGNLVSMQIVWADTTEQEKQDE